jgi:hypothetical protein
MRFRLAAVTAVVAVGSAVAESMEEEEWEEGRTAVREESSVVREEKGVGVSRVVVAGSVGRVAKAMAATREVPEATAE